MPQTDTLPTQISFGETRSREDVAELVYLSEIESLQERAEMLLGGEEVILAGLSMPLNDEERRPGLGKKGDPSYHKEESTLAILKEDEDHYKFVVRANGGPLSRPIWSDRTFGYHQDPTKYDALVINVDASGQNRTTMSGILQNREVPLDGMVVEPTPGRAKTDPVVFASICLTGAISRRNKSQEAAPAVVAAAR